MPKWESQDYRDVMAKPERVRNVCLIGAMGHGKTCLADCIGARSGLITDAKVGETMLGHLRKDEQEGGTSKKAAMLGFILPNEVDDGDNKLLIHLVDTPGHPEFSPEVSATLRLADGMILVVDSAEGGLPVPAEMCLTEGIRAGVKPVLFLNKLDKMILEMGLETSVVYDNYAAIIANTNEVLAVAGKPPPKPDADDDEDGAEKKKKAPEKNLLETHKVDPADGSVVFGSAFLNCGFQLSKFAKVYAAKFKVDEDKMTKRLWGDQFFNPGKKVWTNQQYNDEGKENARGFCQFALEPIKQLCLAAMKDDLAKVGKMIEALGAGEAKKITTCGKTGKPLLRHALSMWLHCGQCVQNMIAAKLPNPVEATKKRTPLLYEGDQNDETAKGMAACDPSAPMIMYVAKMTPQPGAPGRFYAIGRVFGGTAAAESYTVISKEEIQAKKDAAAGAGADEGAVAEEEEAEEGEEEKPKEEEKAAEKPKKKQQEEKVKTGQQARVQAVVLFAGKDAVALDKVPCGNMCAFTGLEQNIGKSASMVSSKTAAHIKDPEFSISPVVQISVKPRDMKELPKLVEGLRRLSRSDLLVRARLEEGGEHVLGTGGTEHLKLLLNDLAEHAPGVKVEVGDPTVSFRECCSYKSDPPFGKDVGCLSKSPNKHNRLFCVAEPSNEETGKLLEAGTVNIQQDYKKRAKILEKEAEWDKNAAMKIWGFAPVGAELPGTCILVDQTKAVQYLNEIKEYTNSGLYWACREGPLAEEPIRDTRFNLLDVKLHSDSVHRGMGQIQPTARRVFYACMLTAGPKFTEPIYKCRIACPADQAGGARQAINAKRGELIEENNADEAGRRVNIDAYIPIAETIGGDGFAKVLSQKTQGKAFVNYQFSHWNTIDADPLDGGGKEPKNATKAYKLMMAIRETKGSKMEPPKLLDYLDKL